ncbi:diguanylate cyclase with Chase2 sensor [Halothece sp. PCC 7418]|uniref:CHASE2 domain-containing protein n=1 Tax=Halothece sp. (strain PCC 7418) TaxID=65093 RepID=UPI0002A0729B|nr:CHASE2 domain-containing protein [Halothece sp. PCC 7418]AFZ42847.1 diguanylate cyclase with Chase2 sensor [Halothece sp. PCC 7418]
MKYFSPITHLFRSQGVLTTAFGISALVILGSLAGLFQGAELVMFDWLIRRRPTEPIDPRIVIVELSEPDLEYLNSWPITDGQLAQLLRQINQQDPVVVGLDLYRDLPTGRGRKALNQTFRSMPNLYGVEKGIKVRVKANPTLEELNQVTLADVIHDSDGKVRRALLAVKQDNQQKLALGTQLALTYLEAQGVEMKNIPSSPMGLWRKRLLPFNQEDNTKIQLGQAVLTPLHRNDGGYINMDNGGYQILINYRGLEFETVSVRDVLENDLPSDIFTDKIVLIGAGAPSLNDLFSTPYVTEDSLVPGVIIHANITSQLLSAALDNRPLIRVLPDPLEWLWIACCTVFGAKITLYLLTASPLTKWTYCSVGMTLVGVLVSGMGLVGMTYLALIGGWWLPGVTPLVGLFTAATVVAAYTARDLQRLAVMDGLTEVANRRYFDQEFQRRWLHSSEKRDWFGVILCDIDCFKKYNDTYGHQEGDRCLKAVAQGIKKAVRSTDFVARYGGEEFAILLSKSSPETTGKIAERVGKSVRELQIPHVSSETRAYVTLSCGVATLIPSLDQAPASLIACADEALYNAKKQGRDRAVIYQFPIPEQLSTGRLEQ